MTVTNQEIEEEMERIENEIQELIYRRGRIFDEWANLVKQNERDAEIKGNSSPELVEKAETLFKEHQNIRVQITKLIRQADLLDD